MVGRASTVAVVGLEAVPITVEAHVGPGLPAFTIIGSSGSAAREAAQRVRTALGALGISLPARKTLVSLAPAEVPKVGARFDLAMALAVLSELGVVPSTQLETAAVLGELALDGAVREVPGVLPSLAALPALGVTSVLVAKGNAREAAIADGTSVVAVAHLEEAVAILCGDQPAPPPPPEPVAEREEPGEESGPDLEDVRGQAEARRALEIAAAGGHHLLLLGPPGAGKSMLARRLPSVLPPLDRDAALELAAIRSVAGTLPAQILDLRAPFRAPHPGLTATALLGGGGGVARPGELSQAHHGVLFVDELLEWPRSALEALRGPLEEGVVRIARARATVTYPARVQLVAAANPCPCGGGPGCACGEEEIWRYRAKLSGPLADRLDLAPTVAPLRADDLLAEAGGEPSAAVAARVAAARRMARQRWGRRALNATAQPAALRAVTRPVALATLAEAVESGQLTGRGYDRALRVARTCADLDGSEWVERAHVLEARAHRLALRAAGAAVAAR